MKALIILAIFLSVNSNATIFGEDNRTDLVDVKNKEIVELSKSIPALVLKKFLKSKNEDEYTLDTSSYIEDFGFCEDEKFVKKQSPLANCSAFLIGTNLVGTAAHCFDDSMNMGIDDYAVVFDYKAEANGAGPKTIKKENVYIIKKIVKQEFEWVTYKDYAVVELTKEVEGRAPLKISIGRRAPVGTELFILGFPLGLPMKYQPSGTIISSDLNKNSFRHQLDTYSVNSGSAVFSAESHEIVGIHVRGTGFNYKKDPNDKCNRWGKGDPAKDWGEANFIDLIL
ncbi:MAG: hypothetical protein CME70_19800 [Halobacteriovorax sp.]|nr:hypothetical protein [Halobacteriovorax sp.]|tara:strand:- start:22087 stop:22935 length:849 start_codon:yes stop_codon:yes gene_type:complete